VGKATPFCDAIMVGEKHYHAVIDLAATSPSFDRGSQRTDIPVPHPPSRAAIDAILPRFSGVIQQRPPAFSALNVGGRRAYDLARAGAPPDLPPRPVTIHELAILDYAFPFLTLHIRCGKGTYIRSLARDLGEALGTGGMLHALRRTRVGAFSIDSARTLDQLPQKLTQADLLPPPSPPGAAPS
jgi:tRNA pseudouridine55 synthase